MLSPSIISALRKYVPPWGDLIGMVMGAAFCIAIFAAMTSADVVPPTVVPIHENPVPVSFNLPISISLAWITSVAIGLGALVAISKLLIKASKLVADISEYHSVILDMAKQFKSDSGSTLKDAINRIEKAAEEAKATALVAQKTSDNLSHLILENQAHPKQ
jgi:hypothetical protein